MVGRARGQLSDRAQGLAPDELRLGPRQLGVRALRALEELSVVQRQGRLIRERLEQRDLFAGEDAARVCRISGVRVTAGSVRTSVVW